MRIVCIVIVSFVAIVMHAQMRLDNRVKVDTLSLKERIALRTNTVDWLLLQANMGVEVDVRNTNWNRWTIGANVRFNWATPHTYQPEWVYDIKELKLEFRNYWRTHPVEGRYFAAHNSLLDKAFSQRRKQPKYRLPAYYRGLYLSYSEFDLRIPVLISERHKGKAISAGVTYGIVKPLYVYRSGNSLDLDLGFSVGLAVQNSQTSTYDQETSSFKLNGEYSGWQIVKHPVLNELRAGVIYRFGKYPVTSRYRRRYDVDREFMNFHDSIFNERERIAYNKHLDDSTYNAVHSFYQHKLDSIVKADPSLAKEKKAATATGVRSPSDLLEPAKKAGTAAQTGKATLKETRKNRKKGVKE